VCAVLVYVCDSEEGEGGGLESKAGRPIYDGVGVRALLAS
jgi:hypothetical protein